MRMDKLNQLIKRLIGEMILLGEVHDPRVRLVTITYADVSKDLSVAHVGFSVLSDVPATINDVQAGLDSARGRIRKLLGERVSIRKTPEIRFVYDDSIASSVRMDRTLEELRQEREQREGVAPENQGPGQQPEDNP
jgi:ribosome-binding factor A